MVDGITIVEFAPRQLGGGQGQSGEVERLERLVQAP